MRLAAMILCAGLSGPALALGGTPSQERSLADGPNALDRPADRSPATDPLRAADALPQPFGTPLTPDAEPAEWEGISRAMAEAHTFGGEQGNTRPSRDSTMAFSMPAEIAEVLVRGGQRVKKGQLLIRGRDDEMRVRRNIQQIIAESDLSVRRAKTALRQAKIELEAQEHLHARNRGGSRLDLARARTTYEIREQEVEHAELERQQHQLELEFRQAQLDRMHIVAPFDGIIDILEGDVGVVRREGEPILRIVATDPLWIDVAAPTRQTMLLGLEPGHPAWVLLDLPGEPVVHMGQVVEVAADADPASNRRRVRVELENTSNWPSGLVAWVRFTEPSELWLSRVVTPERGEAVAEGPRPPQTVPQNLPQTGGSSVRPAAGSSGADGGADGGVE